MAATSAGSEELDCLIHNQRRDLHGRWERHPVAGSRGLEVRPAEAAPRCFMLGQDTATRQPFAVSVDDLRQHVTILGKTGVGKTWSVGRLVSCVVERVGWPVLIADFKGSGDLLRIARRIAERHALPLRQLDPRLSDSLGYNPCTGSPAQIANKLCGAFAYGPEAEVYQKTILEAIPLVVRGLRCAGEAVTVSAIAASLDEGRLRGLAHAAGRAGDAAVQSRIAGLLGRGPHQVKAYAGMRSRLGALIEGEYGHLLNGERQVLDLAAALREPGITYISLPALANADDVDLLARVLAQDLKGIASSRLAGDDAGAGPALLVLDEFAATNEADQLRDLLLQAREALVFCVLAMQFLPETKVLRKAVLGGGVVIAHQCDSEEDAESIATLFGTDPAVETTTQVDWESGYSEKGSARTVDRFRMHPNDLRDLARGVAAVRIQPNELRRAWLEIYPPEAAPTS